MTCLVTLVVLMGAINRKTKSPLVPVLVGGAIVICILAGCVQLEGEDVSEGQFPNKILQGRDFDLIYS